MIDLRVDGRGGGRGRSGGKGYNPNRARDGKFAPGARKAKPRAEKFNAKPHQKAIAKLKAQEAKHRSASLAIKMKMAALKKTARATTPAKRAKLKARFEKMAAKRDALKAKANEAKAARVEASKGMQSARKEHATKQREARAAAKAARAESRKPPAEPKPAAEKAAAKPHEEPAKVFARNGLETKFNDNGREVELSVSSAGGQVGRLRMVKGNDGQYRLSHVAIDKDSLRGKGVGTAMYRSTATYLRENHNSPLLSDYSRSPSAERVWSGLVKAGLAKPVRERGDPPDGPPSYYSMGGP